MAGTAFIAAMRMEIAPFLRRIGIHTRERVGAFPCYRFRTRDQECLLVECGMGVQRGIDAARALLSVVHPQILVSFGIAGSPLGDLRVGDVIIARTASFLENPSPGRSWALTRLPDSAEAAIARALRPRGAELLSGAVFTTRGAQILPSPVKGTLRPVLDMETAGIAQVAAELGVPLLSLRAVSDSAAEPLPFNLEEVLDEKQNFRIGKIVGSLVRHPSRIPRALRAGRNAARAAENLAAAVIAALEDSLSQSE